MKKIFILIFIWSQNFLIFGLVTISNPKGTSNLIDKYLLTLNKLKESPESFIIVGNENNEYLKSFTVIYEKGSSYYRYNISILDSNLVVSDTIQMNKIQQNRIVYYLDFITKAKGYKCLEMENFSYARELKKKRYHGRRSWFVNIQYLRENEMVSVRRLKVSYFNYRCISLMTNYKERRLLKRILRQEVK